MSDDVQLDDGSTMNPSGDAPQQDNSGEGSVNPDINTVEDTEENSPSSL